ncbi:MAG: M56 family metallopeptidase [Pirellulaceae bacterium]|nr:M56 family metallopeptidase [Pirellulaceae bacterium]
MNSTTDLIGQLNFGSGYDWYSVSLTATLSLLHLFWILTLIGVALGVLAKLSRKGRSDQFYAIYIFGLFACTLSIPISVCLGWSNATTWQSAAAANTSLNSATPKSSSSDLPQSEHLSANGNGHDTIWTVSSEDAREEPTNPLQHSRLGLDVAMDGLRSDSEERSSAPVDSIAAVPQQKLDANQKVSVWARFTNLARSCMEWSAPWLTVIYICGMTGMLVRLVRCIRQCQGIVRNACPVEDITFTNLLSDLATRIGCRFSPVLASSNRLSVPVLVGCWRPMIIVPVSMLTGLTPQQWEPILLHELAHLRRYDHWVVLWQRISESILFFHPTIWIINRQLDRHREHCCDDMVIRYGQGRVAYAESLCSVAQLSLHLQPATHSPLAVAATGVSTNHLIERVERILGIPTGYQRKQHRMAAIVSWPAITVSLLLLSALLIVGTPLPEPMLGLTSIGNPSTTPTDNDGTDKYRIEDCLEVDGEDVVIVLRGVFLKPDGTPADNLLEAPTELNLWFKPVDIRIDGSRFEIRAKRGVFWRFKSADGLWQADLSVPDQDLRTRAMSGIELTLRPSDPVPTWRIPVHVVHDGQPVAGARVQLFDVRSETDANGNAVLEVESQVGFRHVIASKDDRLVGASEQVVPVTSVSTAEEFDGRTLTIVLTQARELKLRVIDEKENPVPNLPLTLSFSIDNNSHSFQANALDEVVTDADGVAITKWCPDWPTGRLNVQNNADRPLTVIGTVAPEGIAYFQKIAFLAGLDEVTIQVEHQPPRKTVVGKLQMDGEVPGGFQIVARSMSTTSGMSDTVYTLSANDGTFRFAAIEGRTYDVNLIDSRYVAEAWYGPVFASVEEDVQSPELIVRKGIPIQIQCTVGNNKTPWAGASLQCTTTPIPSRQRSGRSIHVEADDQGVARFWSPPGELSIYVAKKQHTLQKSFRVVEGKSNEFAIHLDVDEAVTFGGRLVLPEGYDLSLDQATIRLIGSTEQDNTNLTIQTDATGRFEVQAASKRLAFFAETADGKWSVAGVLRPEKTEASFELLPSSRFEGELVDEQGTPIAGATLSFIGNFPSTRFVSHPAGHRITSRDAKSDESGRFVVESLPPNIKFSLQRVDRIESKRGSFLATGNHLGQIQMRPGEVRPSQKIVASRSTSSTEKTTNPKDAMDLSLRVNDWLRDCRLSNTHGVVVISGATNRDSVTGMWQKVNEPIDENSGSIAGRFLPLMLDGHEVRADELKMRKLAQQGWSVPPIDHVQLIVLDGTGKELGHTTVAIRDGEAAEMMSELLRTTAPPIEDAAQKLEAAIAEAKASDRKVWVRITQTRCAPCFAFSRWLDDQRAVLEKDFVVVKIDNVNDKNGVEIAQLLLSNRDFGVPVSFFLDGDGNEVGSSYFEGSNTGYPGGSFEGTRHLIETFKSLRRNLTDDELAELQQSLSPYPPGS